MAFDGRHPRPVDAHVVDQQKYTFVTVAHEADWDVLALQARSMHLYLPEDLAAEIIVVDNSSAGVPAEVRDALRQSYGDLSSKVRFISANQIADIPKATNGWLSQQILKLMVCQEVSTNRYVLLDAKNHLVFPLQRSFLESGDRIPAWIRNYEKHSLRPFLEKSLLYFGLNPEDYIKAFLPAITPYTMPTAAVRDLIRFVVEREDKPFPVTFLERGVSEFFLFAAFITMLGKTEEIYDLSGNWCPTIWDENAIRGAGNLRHHIARGEKDALPFFAVHRHAVPWLDGKSRLTIAEFWHRRGLVPTPSDGVKLLAENSGSKPPLGRRFYLRWRNRYSGLSGRIRRLAARSHRS